MNLPTEIRNIAHHIRRETGWCVGFSELIFSDELGGDVDVTVTIHTPDRVECLRGSSVPREGGSPDMSALLEELSEWLIGYRRGEKG